MITMVIGTCDKIRNIMIEEQERLEKVRLICIKERKTETNVRTYARTNSRNRAEIQVLAVESDLDEKWCIAHLILPLVHSVMQKFLGQKERERERDHY